MEAIMVSDGKILAEGSEAYCEECAAFEREICDLPREYQRIYVLTGFAMEDFLRQQGRDQMASEMGWV